MAQLRSEVVRTGLYRRQTALGVEHATTRFEYRHEVAVEPKPGEPPTDLRLCDNLEREAEACCAGDRSGYELALRRAQQQAARHAQQRFTGLRFELLPAGVRAFDQRHVV